MAVTIEIGACNNRRERISNRIEIKPLEDLGRIIREIFAHPQTYNGWVYPESYKRNKYRHSQRPLSSLVWLLKEPEYDF